MTTPGRAPNAEAPQDEGPQIISVAGNTVIRSGGDPCDGVFQVLLGSAKQVFQAGYSNEAPVRLLRPGAWWGWDSLLNTAGPLGSSLPGDEVFRSSLISVSACTVMFVPQAVALEWLKQNFNLLREVLAKTGQRITRSSWTD